MSKRIPIGINLISKSNVHRIIDESLVLFCKTIPGITRDENSKVFEVWNDFRLNLKMEIDKEKLEVEDD